MIQPLAVSLGDPAGVGPEIILAAWLAREAEALPPFFTVGGARLLREAAQALDLPCPIVEIGTVREAMAVFQDALPVISGPDAAYRPAAPSSDGAWLALESLRLALTFAVDGTASGLVTAPVAKSAIARHDAAFIGQTEFCAAACRIPPDGAVMLLAGPHLRTVPLTVHCPLAQVPQLITSEKILHTARIVDAAMRRDFGIAAPRIAITGLNPHAGEDGRMGREEIDTIAPAIATLREEGMDATGPHPADALFAPHKRGSFDVAIAMYHDQALAPMKALDFDAGVNMTIGLPIVRTSPDHGTAFDIAGNGTALPGAMIAAIRMAGEVAARREALAPGA